MPWPFGKIPPADFARVIAPHLGAARPEVLVGPGAGLDCAIVRVAPGRIMALTTDPLSHIPVLGPEISARLACHLLASDLWTSGIAPAYATVDFDLPPALDPDAFARYWQAMSDAWRSLGVAVVAGHTGRYPGSEAIATGAASIIGGATLVGIGEEAAYLTPAFAAPGDRVLVTKGCAIEATAIAAHLVPERLTERIGAEGLARARALVEQVSVVADCRRLLGLEGGRRIATALHDATEGGILGGLLELAQASGHDMSIAREAIPLLPEVLAACEALGGIDPYWTLAEGALIATVRPENVAEALSALSAGGIAAAEVGVVLPGSGRLLLREPSGETRAITEPEPDPYWPAYARAVREAWS